MCVLSSFSVFLSWNFLLTQLIGVFEKNEIHHGVHVFLRYSDVPYIQCVVFDLSDLSLGVCVCVWLIWNSFMKCMAFDFKSPFSTDAHLWSSSLVVIRKFCSIDNDKEFDVIHVEHFRIDLNDQSEFVQKFKLAQYSLAAHSRVALKMEWFFNLCFDCFWQNQLHGRTLLFEQPIWMCLHVISNRMARGKSSKISNIWNLMGESCRKWSCFLFWRWQMTELIWLMNLKNEHFDDLVHN